MRFNRKVSKNEQNRTKLKQTLVVKLKMTLIKKKDMQLLGTNSHILSVTNCNYSILLPSLPLRSREESCTSCRFHRWVLVEKTEACGEFAFGSICVCGEKSTAFSEVFA